MDFKSKYSIRIFKKMSDDDKDEEISTSFCPYKKAKGFFSGMFSGSKPENIDTKSTAITTERSLNESDD